MNEKRLTLFGEESVKPEFDEWVDMPEFVQPKKEAYKTLIIRFNNEEDYQEFATLIDQKLTNKTKSIWHPHKSHWRDTISLWEADDE